MQDKRLRFGSDEARSGSDARHRLVLEFCDEVVRQVEDVSVVVDLILQDLGYFKGLLFLAGCHGVDEEQLSLGLSVVDKPMSQERAVNARIG